MIVGVGMNFLFVTVYYHQMLIKCLTYIRAIVSRELRVPAKKPRKAKPPAGVKKSMPQNGDVPSEEEENQEPNI